MTKRTTIELDEELLERAKKSLGKGTTRATVEEALRRAVEAADSDRESLRDRQVKYLASLASHLDLDVLKSEEMWR